MLRRTETGIGVLYVFRPLPIGLVFEDEDLLIKANTRYWMVILSYLLYCMAKLGFFKSQSNEPDWWFTVGYISIPLSMLACYLIIYLLMPLRVLYDEEKHGAIQHPTEKA